MSDDRRKLLAGIAYSPDASVSASDRLRALELLDEAAPSPDPVIRLLSQMPSDEATLDRELDAMLSAEIIESIEAGQDHATWPLLAAGVRALVERKAAELADEGRIQRLVEERARELAAELYVGQGLANLAGTLESVPNDVEGTDTAGKSPEASEAVRELPTVPALAFPDELPRRARRRRI